MALIALLTLVKLTNAQFFSLRKLTSSMSPYSPKSRFNLSSENVSKSSTLPIYTLRVAPACTAKASAGWSGPAFLPQPSLIRRLFSVRPWYDAAWKKVSAAAGSINVTNWQRCVSIRDLRATHKGTHGYMLVLHVSYALQHASANCIAQVLRRCLRMNVAKVHRPVCSLRDTKALPCEGRVGAKPEAANIGVDGAERCRSRLRDKGLSCNSLGCLCRGLLGLGDVRATVFTIVDPLSGPRRFCGKCVHNLEKKQALIHKTDTSIGGSVPLWRQRCSKSGQSRYSCHGQF